MKRGEFYSVKKPGSRDPRKQRVFLVVSRQTLIDSRFSSVICTPVYSQHDGLATQLNVGLDEGLKKGSSVHCDKLASLAKSALSHYVGTLGAHRATELDQALAVALGLE